LCSIGGLRMDAHADGTNVANLTGYAAPMTVVLDYLVAATSPFDVPDHLAILPGDDLYAENLGFEPEIWRRIAELRGSIDDWAWTRHNWQLLAFDQDVLDLDTAVFRALCAGNRLLLTGPIHRMIKVNKDAELMTEVEDIYSWGSLGGVAVGKGKYSDGASKGTETVDLDGDERTTNSQEG